MKVRVLFLLQVLLFSSCENSDEQLEAHKQQEHQKLVTKAVQKYNALEFDSISEQYLYTYQFQEILRKNKTVVLGDCYLHDVVMSDSIYILYLNGHDIHFELNCPKSEFEKLILTKNVDDVDFDLSKACVVIYINSLDKMHYQMYGSYNADDVRVDLGLEDGGSFIFKGDILEIINKD